MIAIGFSALCFAGFGLALVRLVQLTAKLRPWTVPWIGITVAMAATCIAMLHGLLYGFDGTQPRALEWFLSLAATLVLAVRVRVPVQEDYR